MQSCPSSWPAAGMGGTPLTSKKSEMQGEGCLQCEESRAEGSVHTPDWGCLACGGGSSAVRVVGL